MTKTDAIKQIDNALRAIKEADYQCGAIVPYNSPEGYEPYGMGEKLKAIRLQLTRRREELSNG